MTRHEREEFGPETRDVIEGLRRLALDAEPPVELLARVKQEGIRSLPAQRDAIGRWRRLLPRWAWQPAVWGPAVAALCFLAGVVVSSSDVTPWSRDVASTVPASAPKQQRQAEPATGTEIAEPAADPEQHWLMEGSAAPIPEARQLTTRFVIAPSPSPAASSAQITIALAPALYEQLLWEARRRPGGLATIVHEAVVTYLHTDRTE